LGGVKPIVGCPRRRQRGGGQRGRRIARAQLQKHGAGARDIVGGAGLDGALHREVAA
jgi:hypothetical protein